MTQRTLYGSSSVMGHDGIHELGMTHLFIIHKGIIFKTIFSYHLPNWTLCSFQDNNASLHHATDDADLLTLMASSNSIIINLKIDLQKLCQSSRINSWLYRSYIVHTYIWWTSNWWMFTDIMADHIFPISFHSLLTCVTWVFYHGEYIGKTLSLKATHLTGFVRQYASSL